MVRRNISIFILFTFLYSGIYAQVKPDTFFTENEVLLKTASGDISGTLTVTNKSKKSPIVILIAGSGPTDRDCNSPMGIKTNAYKMISWMKYDPAVEIKKLKIPVLIIQGSTDLQVSVYDARLLQASKPDARLLIIENMNHVMKESDSYLQKNLATYGNPDLPLKPELTKELIQFIKAK